jgi:hypothetical protein
MADFASLLGSFNRVHSILPVDQDIETDAEPEQPLGKRVRQLDAKDFAPVEKVFLICPAGVQTGGPEALHQLCDQLNESTNIPAYMLYVVGDGGAVRFASRAKPPYRIATITHRLSDDALQQGHASHLFLWPECWTDEMMDYLEHGESDPTPCAIWWLSVNNNTARFKAWSKRT